MHSIDIVSAIEKRMRELDINVFQLARKTGVSSSTIYRWLERSYNPRVDTMLTCMHALGLDFLICYMGSEDD